MEHPHAGHRKRMRQRYAISGLDGFQDHEVLELLLFYAIPRRDVNELAHALVKRFGSFCGVVEATEEELQTVPGIGPRTAQLIRFLPVFNQRHMLAQHRGLPCLLEKPDDMHNLISPYILARSEPGLFLVFIDALHYSIAVHSLDPTALPTPRTIMERAIPLHAAAVALVECSMAPSDELDPVHTEAVRSLARSLRILNTPLWDYFLWSTISRELISYRQHGQLIGV